MCSRPAGDDITKYTASAISWQHIKLCHYTFMIHVAMNEGRKREYLFHTFVKKKGSPKDNFFYLRRMG